MAGGSRKNADTALVAALAGGATVEAAAKLAGVSERTVYRRLENAGFRRQVAEARAAMIERATAKLAEASTEAAATLRALLDASSPPAVRLGAARAILELGTRLREAEELEKRIAELEVTLASQSEERTRRWA